MNPCKNHSRKTKGRPMAGHSKWANIQHRKGRQTFTKNGGNLGEYPDRDGEFRGVGRGDVAAVTHAAFRVRGWNYYFFRISLTFWKANFASRVRGGRHSARSSGTAAMPRALETSSSFVGWVLSLGPSCIWDRPPACRCRPRGRIS